MGKTHSAAEAEERLRELLREVNGAHKDLQATMRKAQLLTEEVFDREIKSELRNALEQIRSGTSECIKRESERTVEYFNRLMRLLNGRAKELSKGRNLMEIVQDVAKEEQVTALYACDVCTRGVSNMDVWTHWCAQRPDQIPLDSQRERIQVSLKRDMEPAFVHKLYSMKAYYEVHHVFREDPRWFLCPDCHDILVDPNSHPAHLLKQWDEHHGDALSSTDPIYLNKMKDAIYGALTFFWYWRIDTVEPPGTYRLASSPTQNPGDE